jgi:hypothetical protein
MNNRMKEEFLNDLTQLIRFPSVLLEAICEYP